MYLTVKQYEIGRHGNRRRRKPEQERQP